MGEVRQTEGKGLPPNQVGPHMRQFAHRRFLGLNIKSGGGGKNVRRDSAYRLENKTDSQGEEEGKISSWWGGQTRIG